jgi:hypothetical protein
LLALLAGAAVAQVGAPAPSASPASASVGAEPEPVPPPGLRRLPASADECAVWRREASFARSVARHDARSFESHLHPGTVFDAGTPDAERGSAAVTTGWARIIEGRGIVLRWRPGIVHIGGHPGVAVSRGPWIVQSTREGATTYSVGFYQTVWIKEPGEASWRVLFDGGASTPIKLADRAAAEAWVAEQPMSDCAGA